MRESLLLKAQAREPPRGVPNPGPPASPIVISSPLTRDAPLKPLGLAELDEEVVLFLILFVVHYLDLKGLPGGGTGRKKSVKLPPPPPQSHFKMILPALGGI